MNSQVDVCLLTATSSFKFQNGIILVLKSASDESIFKMPILDNLSTLMSSMLLSSEAKLHFVQWVELLVTGVDSSLNLKKNPSFPK